MYCLGAAWKRATANTFLILVVIFFYLYIFWIYGYMCTLKIPVWMNDNISHRKSFWEEVFCRLWHRYDLMCAPNEVCCICILSTFLQTLPHDSQKIRNQLGGHLYAYELPPVDNIETISADEEISDKKSNIGLSEIQRGISASKSSNLVRLIKKPCPF